MFTGIVTALGTVRDDQPAGRRRRHAPDHRRPPGPIPPTIPIGASIGCSGCCLTAVEIGADWFAADASAETLARTTLGRWRAGTRVNLERSLRLGDELGGHLVSGHVDGVGEVLSADAGTRLDPLVVFRVPADLARFIAVKGSVAVDGVSLTVNEVTDDTFGVNIIPHTAAVTSFGSLRPGDAVNLEIDMLARYVARLAEFTVMQQNLKTVELSQYLSAADELIEEARNGRMFILVDDEDRENEGDLVVPAQFATPDAINFMARHARGLVCLAMHPPARGAARPAADERSTTARGTRPRSPSRSRRARASPPASPRTTAPAPSRWRSIPNAAATTSSRPATSSR